MLADYNLINLMALMKLLWKLGAIEDKLAYKKIINIKSKLRDDDPWHR